ncbi:MAG: ABC transporter substrate-binding protein [Myxococcota bacterium]|nr:ABC transporter substrate-binding protein [Myxococcota bacterium]
MLCPAFFVACASSPPTERTAFVEPLPPSVTQARNVVQRLHDETIAISRLGSELSFEQRRERLMKLDLESFNFSRMAQLSYGKGFEKLSPDQKRLWVDTFILLRCSGSAKVNARYRGQEYRFVGYDRVSDDVVLIRSGVRYPKRAMEIAIDYRLLRKGGRWRIVDRYAPPSVSEVVMRRAEYRTILQEEGFDGLILDMERRIRGYSAR